MTTKKATNMVFVGGLPHDVSEQGLKDAVVGYKGLVKVDIRRFTFLLLSSDWTWSSSSSAN